MYEYLGMPTESDFSIRKCRKSAESGYAFAQAMLGQCYLYGQFVEKNYAEAARWSRKAAEQGLAIAQDMLGLCYKNGWGVAQDKDEALRLYNNAAAQGDDAAQKRLDELAHPASSGSVASAASTLGTQAPIMDGFIDTDHALDSFSLDIILGALDEIREDGGDDIFDEHKEDSLICLLKGYLAGRDAEKWLSMLLVERGLIRALRSKDSSAPQKIKNILAVNGLGGAAVDEFVEKLRKLLG